MTSTIFKYILSVFLDILPHSITIYPNPLS